MEKHPIGDLMGEIVDKVREIADANTIVGQPIVTGEVTIIPISRLSVGVGSGGTEFGSKHKKPEDNSCFGGGAGAGVKIDPVAFLVIKDGITRVLPVAVPPVSTVDRIVEMTPDLLDKVEKYFDKKEAKETL